MSYYLTLKALDPDGSKGIFAPNNPKFGKGLWTGQLLPRKGERKVGATQSTVRGNAPAQ